MKIHLKKKEIEIELSDGGSVVMSREGMIELESALQIIRTIEDYTNTPITELLIV